MAEYTSLGDFFGAVANAIREKKGTTDKIVPINFPEEIASIEAGGGFDMQDYIENGVRGDVYFEGTSIAWSGRFQGSSITSFIAPNMTTTSASLFSGCKQLKTAYLPNESEVMALQYFNCESLEEYISPTATWYNSQCFKNCLSLKKVDMQSQSAVTIASSAFSGCSSLVTLIIRKTSRIVSLGNANALKNTPIASGTGYIYVPSALINTYKSDSKWSSFSSQFRAIEDYPDICG